MLLGNIRNFLILCVNKKFLLKTITIILTIRQEKIHQNETNMVKLVTHETSRESNNQVKIVDF